MVCEVTCVIGLWYENNQILEVRIFALGTAEVTTTPSLISLNSVFSFLHQYRFLQRLFESWIVFARFSTAAG